MTNMDMIKSSNIIGSTWPSHLGLHGTFQNSFESVCSCYEFKSEALIFSWLDIHDVDGGPVSVTRSNVVTFGIGEVT